MGYRGEEYFEEVARRLTEWYRRRGRDFPWRHTRDPYVILATEFLLQRTRAETVAKVFEEFFSRYPSPESLANADPEELRKFFSRLGLVRRADALREAAREIVERHGGSVPRSKEELLKLKGVGPYIASAVLCFAYSAPVPVVDTNVARVLGRAAGASSRGEAEAFLERLLRHGNPREISLALIDLGALVCTRKPRCPECPLSDLCSYRGSGRTGAQCAGGASR